MSQLKVRLGSILKALVTVELQLCGDLFFSLCSADGIQYQLGTLFRSGFVGNDTVVIEITDDGKEQEALPGADIRNVGCPFLIWSVGRKVSVQQIGIAVFLPVTVDHFVFDACFHPFPVAVFRSKVSFPLLGASFSVEFYIIPRYNIVSEYRLTQSP